MDDKSLGRAVVVLFMLVFVVYVDSAILARKDLDHASSKKLQKLDLGRAKRFLLRQRRDASTAPPDNKNMSEPLTEEVVLNGTEEHIQAFVHWSGKLKSEAVFVLTLKFNQSRVADSQTWRSLDYGSTYQKLEFGGDALITFFYVSPADHTKMVFTDVKHKRLYTSEDEMKTKTNKSLPVAADDIQMHHDNSSWMLLYDFQSRKLFVSMDFGDTWFLLQTDVNSRFSWGVKGTDDPKVVHLEVQPEDSEQAYYKRCTIPHCTAKGDGIDFNLGPFMTQTMLVINEYIFVQKSNLDGSESHMMVSYKRAEFAHAYFPDNIVTNDFMVLNATEGQVFMAVNHGDRLGVSLYLSDPTGQNYVLSLANVHHRSAAHWFDVDIHRVEGLNGVFLANQMMNSSSLIQKPLRSFISLNKGGSWINITSTQKDCSSDKCAILLRLDMASFLHNWILSEENAPGFLIAHGHYGSNYEHDLKNMSVFTSVDGGVTWDESSLKGVYYFNILDQGSLVTAIKTGQQELTNVVHYSSNEGKNWTQVTFGKKKVIIDGVLNEPAINTLAATVYGHENTSAAWTMVKLNFSQVLTKQCVNKTDYEYWMPGDNDKDLSENCLLGQELVYWRQKRDAQCYNGEDFFRPKINHTCPCRDEDFECDFGFARVGSDCKQEPWFNDAYLAPKCTYPGKFNKSQGYRKVGSDKCTNGVENQGKYKYNDNATCPLVAPSHLHLYVNVTLVATGKPIHFHLTQKKGSIHNSTMYVWNYNGTKKPKIAGLAAAQSQVETFAKPGIYYVNVTATNTKGSNTSDLIRIRVEEPVKHVEVFSATTIKVGFPLAISVATNIQSSKPDSSLHYQYHFDDEDKGTRDTLTWNSSVTHIYSKVGTYVLTVTAVNSVSAMAKQVTIHVIDGGVMLQLDFSQNVNRLLSGMSASKERVFMVLDFISHELTRMLGVNLDRLASVNIGLTYPVHVNVLVIPPPPKAPQSEATAKKIADTLVEMATNKSLLLFHTLNLPKAWGDIAVTSVKILKGGGGGGNNDGKKSGANYRAVYIAIPIVLLAALVTLLVLVYYRRRFRNMRRYNVVSQHEDTDALLDDDDDEPPLDLRSDTRGDGHRDDAMLDLGSGSHLVMVTGNGGGDGAENC
ncbi:VPS10 domain-containing receptor SorCS2-like isoform X2 [Littorina saxatilis]|uniref:PKD domain-containing protein n=1 Tax=Littorina saxatilis TaxID=31220 RepID=A0AAN9BT22_9CAEN